jgi:hypothetical protein
VLVPSSDIVTRPEAGLARGAWEATPTAFFVALAVLVIASLLYLLYRLGVLKRRQSAASATATPPSPTGAGRS